jgi:hypothetical protein
MAESFQGFRVRKLADKSSGAREKRFDPVTGDSYLVDPETWDADDQSTWVNTPWPSLGVAVEGELPEKTTLNTGFVNKAVSEGWATLEGREIVHRPGGPADDPWKVTHTFVQADAITFNLAGQTVKYKVLESPDKYPAEKNEFDEGFGGDVNWFFVLELAEVTETESEESDNG